MPSPAAHSLIGLALGFARFVPSNRSFISLARDATARWRELLLCVVLANAPDVDYLFGLPSGDFNRYHQMYSHTFGWVAALTLTAFAFWRAKRPCLSWRFLGFLAVLTMSHLAADYFTEDASLPRGIMIAWPFSSSYMTAAHPIFPRWAKSNWTELISLGNLRPLGIEIAITLPLVLAAVLYKIAACRWKKKTVQT